MSLPRLLPLALLGLFCSAPAWAGRNAPEARTPPVPPAPRYSPPAPASTSPGSLWSEQDATALVGLDSGARDLGDLVTVNIYEDTQSSVEAKTGTGRSTNRSGGITSLFGLVKGIGKANPDMGDNLGFGVGGETAFDGGGNTSRSGMLSGQLTCEVIDILPNGDLVLWGYKEVRANHETEYLVLEGTVRPQDIQADNTVISTLMARKKVEYSGQGAIGDLDGPSIPARILNHAFPF